MKQLTIRLTPGWGFFQLMETVNSLDVDEWFSGELINMSGIKQDKEQEREQDAPAFCFPDLAFGGRCPFPEWDYLKLEDEQGQVPFHLAPIPTLDDNMTFQGVFLDRPAHGAVHLSYRIFPRVLPENYRRSPCFDFRAEPLGLTGTGLFSLILPFQKPEDETRFQTSLSWNLSALPEGSRAILSLGEGEIHQQFTRKDLADTMFAVGKMQAIEEKNVGFYYFSDPPFDIKQLAAKVLPIYEYEKEYFRDPSAGFRVFIRRDPFTPSGAGSACPYGFITTYSCFDQPEQFANTEELLDLFLHEMTHTWPAMEDEATGEGTWFCEGATEYYCTMLPYWGGFASAEETCRKINRKISESYLENPYREMPAGEIAKIQWQDLRAQHVPYGRGMLYIACTEAKLRAQNKRSILELVRQHNIKNPMTRQEWIAFIADELGEEGVRDFYAMEAGKIPKPEPALFGPEIQTVPTTCVIEEKEVPSLRWGRF
ncbi:MAG: hypothetical protein J6P72_05880 [Firmicutes bacterium]|nr:hypothetical protein [Bacillota bacterium]